MAFKVVVTDYLFDTLEPFLKELEGLDVDIAIHQERELEKIIPLVLDADVVFVHHANINAQVIQAMEHCKMITRPAIGFDNIDVDAATQKGIYVTNIPEYGAQHDVSNHVILLMLACVKKLWTLASDVKRGGWDINIAKPIRRLTGQTLGLCGFGRIPKRIVPGSDTLEMNVVAYDPYMSAEAIGEFGVKKVDFDTLCAVSDVISITLPLNQETKYLFDEKAFQKMKKTAYIINTARGAVIKERDLIKALEAGEIAGAGLDVLENERPDPDHPFHRMDNVIVTPHSAWFSEDSKHSLLGQCGQQAAQVFRAGAPTHSVNAPAKAAD